MSRKLVNIPTWVTAQGQFPFNKTGAGIIAQSLAADFSTIPTNLQYQDPSYYHINVVTTDSTGTFFLECSGDKNNWATVGTAGTAAASNDTIVCEFDLSRCAPWVRLRYAASVAGTGIAQILIGSKAMGS
jgi:hypothetical protein